MRLNPPEPPLQDDAVLVRSLHPSDASAVAAACRDPEIARWTIHIPPDYKEEYASLWIASTEDGWGRGIADFAVIERATSEFVGAIGLVVREPWIGEIGYWTAAPFRGLGYTTRALRLVTAWSHTLGLTRIQLSILVGNDASESVAAKAGFTREGTLRRYANQRGTLRDVTTWSSLAADA